MRSQCISRPCEHLLLADHRDVVLRLTQATTQALQPMHDARSIGHAPGVAVVRLRRVQRHVRAGLCSACSRSPGCSRHSASVARRTSGPAGHGVVVLRAGQLVGGAGLGELHPAAAPQAHRSGGSRQASKPTPLPTRPTLRAAVAEGHRDGVERLSGGHPDRCAQRAAVERELDDVVARQPEPLGRGGGDQHRVVPGELGERPRQLVQPAVVRELPVEHVRIEAEGRARGRRSAAGAAAGPASQSAAEAPVWPPAARCPGRGRRAARAPRNRRSRCRRAAASSGPSPGRTPICRSRRGRRPAARRQSGRRRAAR